MKRFNQEFQRNTELLLCHNEHHLYQSNSASEQKAASVQCSLQKCLGYTRNVCHAHKAVTEIFVLPHFINYHCLQRNCKVNPPPPKQQTSPIPVLIFFGGRLIHNISTGDYTHMTKSPVKFAFSSTMKLLYS